MRISIFNKIFISQLALIALAAGGVSLAGCYFMARHHHNAVNDALRVSSAATAMRIAGSMARHKEVFAEIAGLREESLSAEKYRQLVSAARTTRHQEHFPLLSFADQEGNLENLPEQGDTGQASSSLSGFPVFRASLATPNQVISGEIAPDPVSQAPTLQFACARIDPVGGEFLGLLLGQAPLSGIVGPAAPDIAPKNGFCRVVAADGRILADPLPANILKPLTPASGSLAGFFPTPGSAPSGRVHHAVLNGEESYFTLAVIPGTPWLAMAILPARHYNEAPEIFRHEVMLVFSGLLLLTGIVAFFLFSRITAPIRMLAAAGIAVGRRKFSPLPVTSGDELGELTESFNTMTRKLSALADREKELQAAEESARLKAALADRHKREFLAGINHELRAPLTAILGISQKIETDPAPGAPRAEIAAINKAGRTLLALVDDLLDFSRLENGELPLACAPFDLYAILGSLKNRYEPLARAKGLRLNYHEATAVPTTVVGDRERISRVLGHLLDNAVKYTDQGEISLRVRLLGLKAVGDEHIIELRFEVADTGPGIAPDEQTDMFEAFSRGDTPAAGKSGGLGIGLALSRQIIERMHGTIGVKSEPGKGSTFFVEIDLPVARQGADAAPLTPPTPDTGEQPPLHPAANQE